jgi:WD40 repeat protein
MSDQDTLARVFISYSRSDADVAQTLVDRLNDAGFDAYLDVHDIAPGEPWRERLGSLISGSEKVVFLISPQSVASEICAWEVDEAERQAKGILPVVLRDTPTAEIPGRLVRLNFIFMRTAEERSQNLEDLVSALSTDLAWEREKTEVNQLALEWEAGGSNDRSLRFADDKIAGWERWRDSHPPTAAAPTELQLAFVFEARRVATARQRRTTMLSIGAAVVAVVLSIIAWTQRQQAVENERRAEIQRNAAQTSQSQFLADLAEQRIEQGRAVSAMLIALEGLPDPVSDPDRPLVREADIALTRAMGLVRMSAVYAGHAVVSPDWSTAVVGVETAGSAWLIDPRTLERIVDLGPTDRAEYSATGKRLLTRHPHPGAEATDTLRDAQTGAVLIEFEDPPEGRVGFSPAGRYLLRGKAVWDAEGVELLYERSDPTYVSFSPSDATLVRTHRKDDRVWFELRRASDNHLIRDGSGAHVARDTPNARIAVRAGTSTVEIVDTRSGRTMATLDGAAYGDGISGISSLVFADGLPILQIGHRSAPDILWHYEEDRIETAPENFSIYCPPGSPPTPDTHGSACGTAVSADGQRRITLGGDAPTLRDARDDAFIAELEGHLAHVERAVFSADSRHILTLTRSETHIPFDHFARLWDAGTGELVATLEHRGAEFDAGFSPDGQFLYTGGGGVTHFWRAAAGGTSGGVRKASPQDRIVVDDRGQRAARAGADGIVELIDFASGARQRCAQPAAGPAHTLRFTPDGTHLLLLSKGGVVSAWDTECRLTGSTASLGSGPRSAEISGDGTRMVADLDSAVVVLGLPGLEALATIARSEPQAEPDHADNPPVRINRTGERLAVPIRTAAPQPGPDAIVFQIFDVANQVQVGPLHAAASAVFSADGSRIVLTGKDSGILDAVTGKELVAFPMRLEAFDQVAFEPTGRFVVVLSDADKTVRIFDAASGQLVDTPQESWFYPFGLGPVVFSSDGSRFIVLTSGQDTSQNRFDLFETATGRLLKDQMIGDGNSAPGSAVFGPEDETIVTTMGKEIIIYDATSFEIVSRMTVPAPHVAMARPSADGMRIVAELGSGLAPTEQMVAFALHRRLADRVTAAKRLAARCLTSEERREIFVSEDPPRWCITGPGLETQTDPAKWRPLYPYTGEAWRDGPRRI